MTTTATNMSNKFRNIMSIDPTRDERSEKNLEWSATSRKPFQFFSEVPDEVLSLILNGDHADPKFLAVLLRSSQEVCEKVFSRDVTLAKAMISVPYRIRLVHHFLILDRGIQNLKEDDRYDPSCRDAATFTRLLEHLMTGVTPYDVNTYMDSYESKMYHVCMHTSPMHVYILFLRLPWMRCEDDYGDVRKLIFRDILERIFHRYRLSWADPAPDDDGLWMIPVGAGFGVVRSVWCKVPWTVVHTRAAIAALEIRSLPLLEYLVCEVGFTHVPSGEADVFMDALGRTSVAIHRYLFNLPHSQALSIENNSRYDWSRMLETFLHVNDRLDEMELMYVVVKRACRTHVDAPATMLSIFQKVRCKSDAARRVLELLREDTLKQLKPNTQCYDAFLSTALGLLCDRGHVDILRDFLELFPLGKKENVIPKFAIQHHIKSSMHRRRRSKYGRQPKKMQVEQEQYKHCKHTKTSVAQYECCISTISNAYGLVKFDVKTPMRRKSPRFSRSDT